jgi:hypothetical protein
MRPPRLALAALAAGALAVAGCGESCPTETPQVQAIASCQAMAANTLVSVAVRLCPKCNQVAAGCEVDLSAAQTDNLIQLDPTVETCDSATNCPPTCDVRAMTCSFVSPPPGNYTIFALDPQTGHEIRQPFDVAASGGSTSCSLGAALTAR